MGQRVRLVRLCTQWGFCWRTRLTCEMVRDLGQRQFNNSTEPQISPSEQPTKRPAPSAVLWQLRFLWRGIYRSNLHCVPDFTQCKLVGVSAYLIREVETSLCPIFAYANSLFGQFRHTLPFHFFMAPRNITPLTDFTAVWQILPSVSQWVLNTVRNGYRIQFATHPPHFQGVVVMKVRQNETIYFSNKNSVLF